MKWQRFKAKAVFRAVTLLLATVVLGGCATYHQTRYGDSGAYYGSAGGYGGYTGGYSSSLYSVSNPTAYPYWSIDHFYFSRHYHPYSVYVGYREPLYYPYPGWAFGHYRAPRARHSASYGFGYPWHGFEHRYPRFSLGFFASHGAYRHGAYRRDRFFRERASRHHDQPIRQIDQRLAELQYRRAEGPRRTLLSRGNGGPANRAGFVNRAGNAARSATGSSTASVPARSGQQQAARRGSRTALLNARDPGARRARSTQSGPGEPARLRGRDDYRDDYRDDARDDDRDNYRDDYRAVSRQASRRTDPLRRPVRRANNEIRPGRERAAQTGASVENLRKRVIVGNRVGNRVDNREDRARRGSDSRRGERTARALERNGIRKNRQRLVPNGGDVSRGRPAAAPARDASPARGSLIQRERRGSDRGARAAQSRPERSAPRRSAAPRTERPSAERKSRESSRGGVSRGGGRSSSSSSRHDRLRSRSDGRRRR